jgi:hypothetical protein
MTRLLVKRAWPSRVVAGAEEKAQQESGSETADVRHVSDTPLRVPEGRGVLVEYLDHDPEAEDDDGWQLNRGKKQYSERHDGPNSIPWKHDEISPEHSGYRAGCPKRRNGGIRVNENLGERRRHSAYEIEDQELSVTEVVFDIVPEYPEIKHVAEDVHPAAMHEHRGE